VTGLIASLAGDIFLMLPRDRFAPGLVSFLIAQLLYVAAFWSVTGPSLTLAAAVPFALLATALLVVLWPHLGRLRVPVVLYAAALMTMGWRAAEQHALLSDGRTAVALLGAILFIASDSVLAFRRFVSPFPAAQAITLGTYFPAQWLIALSVYPLGLGPNG
jgi:uncharacterized membrane protein YhhN